MILGILALLLGISNLVLLFILNKKYQKDKSNYIKIEDLNIFKTELNNKISWLSHYKERIDKKLTHLKTIITHVKNSPK